MPARNLVDGSAAWRQRGGRSSRRRSSRERFRRRLVYRRRVSATCWGSVDCASVWQCVNSTSPGQVLWKPDRSPGSLTWKKAARTGFAGVIAARSEQLASLGFVARNTTSCGCSCSKLGNTHARGSTVTRRKGPRTSTLLHSGSSVKKRCLRSEQGGTSDSKYYGAQRRRDARTLGR